MILKEQAIVLLNRYLDFEYNQDPLYNDGEKRKAHLLSIGENEFCWKIFDCKESEVNKEKFSSSIGAGPFFIDKTTGEIYGTTSAPHIQFEEDFIYYKQHGQSLLDWFPLKIEYLKVELSMRSKVRAEPVQLQAKYESRTRETKEFLLEKFDNVNIDFSSLEIRYKPIDGIDCLILVNGYSGTEKTEEKMSVSLPFNGGFEQFTKTLVTLKKWVRVNGMTLGDDAWIEVKEKDWTKDFNDWELVGYLNFF